MTRPHLLFSVILSLGVLAAASAPAPGLNPGTVPAPAPAPTPAPKPTPKPAPPAPAAPKPAPATPTPVSLLPHMDFSAPVWKPHFVKPPTHVTTRIESKDGGCGGNTSGLLLKQAGPLPAGQYVVSFDARAVSGTLNVTYGLNDLTLAQAALTTSWRGYQTIFTWDGGAKLTPADVKKENLNRVFEIYESTARNTPWEVRRLSVRKREANGTVGPELIPVQDPGVAPWLPFCAAPKLTTSVMFTGRDAAPDNPRSGVLYTAPKPPVPAGRYRVTFTGRSVSGPMTVVYGMNDTNAETVLLDREWKTFTTDFTLAAPKTQVDRLFQIYENGPRNSSWEIREVSVVKLP